MKSKYFQILRTFLNNDRGCLIAYRTPFTSFYLCNYVTNDRFQMDLKKRLVQAITRNRLGHALLFLGENQAEKERLAIALSSGLLCENKEIPFGCQTCPSCKQMAIKQHPRVSFLDAPEIRVDQIRELIRTPGNPSWILPHAQHMNPQASNALLKTLEEPREKQFFILISPNTRSLLATLVSRCQRIFLGSQTHENSPKINIPRSLLARLELAERLSKDKEKVATVLMDSKQLKARQDLEKHLNPQLILEAWLLSEKIK